MKLDYKIPEKLNLSVSVKHLLGRIFVKDPSKRISIAEIKQHSWYLHRLPYELQEGYKGFERCLLQACFLHLLTQCCMLFTVQCHIGLQSSLHDSSSKRGAVIDSWRWN
jgi:serine/threonine protein kinase